MMQGNWISCEERLPQDGQHVLAYRPDSNHFVDLGTPVNICLVFFKRGRIYKEGDCKVSHGDQWGNNLRPYCWDEHGAMSYFGQEMSHWMPLPNPPTP